MKLSLSRLIMKTGRGGGREERGPGEKEGGTKNRNDKNHIQRKIKIIIE